jgi:galactose mutarotase-like enzyme
MYSIENDQLKIGVAAAGAELKSVFHKTHRLEYMWDANPAFWAKTSPVLFPVVGQLRNNSYVYGEKTYTLPRHGFAREKDFALAAQDGRSLTFTLESSEATMSVYPFRFRFSIIYSLAGDELAVTYKLENRGEDTLLFSVGGHPAFKLPLVEGTTYEDYRLLFAENENAGRWPISSEGTIGTEPEPLLQDTNELALKKELFAKDAVVFKHLRSDSVRLYSDKTPHGLHFDYAGFPYLGLWASPGADFLCIEPWCGIADSVDASGLLEEKEGINRLAPGETFDVTWRVRFF